MKFPKIFSVLLIGLFIWSTSAHAVFRDVAYDYEYREAIEYVEEKGIIEGYLDGRYYRPKTQINRAEFIKILIAGRYDEQVIQSCIQPYKDKQWWYVYFPDIETKQWYAPYVCVAQQEGIIHGYPDRTFRPAENISFVEAAKIITNVFRLPKGSGSRTWYEPYVRSLEERKAIPPTIDHFASLITRAEVAEIIYLLDTEITNKPSKTYAQLDAIEIPPCESCIVIDKLGITAPVVFGIGEQSLIDENWRQLEKDLLVGLRDGVVHYPGTAKPGDIGNAFITGHSSYYTNDPGKYNYVFTKLGELQVGDTYKVYFQGKKHEYQIYEEKIVWPEDTSVLYQPRDKEISTLMTCWPIYTNYKRKIFVADRIG